MTHARRSWTQDRGQLTFASGPQERSDLLRRWSDLMLLHRDQLAQLITFECVSTLAC